MATRMIKQEFWSDTYVEDLDMDEKLLFLYLLTNPLCNVCGIYQITQKRISYETGIDKKRIEQIFKKLEDDKKIIQADGWIVIINFTKHQSTKSPDVIKGIQRILEGLPTVLKEKIEELGGSIEGLGTVYRLSRELNSTLLNSTLPNLTQPNAPAGTVSAGDVIKILMKFKKLSPNLTGQEKNQKDACKHLLDEYGLEDSMKIVEQAIIAQGKKYAPKILTPVDLWKKIGDLQVFLKRSQEENNPNKVGKV